LGGTVWAPETNPDVITDVWLRGLALAGTGVGWVTGEREHYQPGDETTFEPFLLRLQNDSATPVDMQQVGLPAVAHLGQVAISPNGSSSWAAWYDAANAVRLAAIQMPAR
jgi:hypothetical protein